MPYIKTVVAKDLKGRTFNHNLSPLTVVCGLNMTGKTALLDAIRLAWLGRTLNVSAKSGELFHALSSGESMSTGVFFDDGTSIERAWTRKADKVSSVVRNPNNLSVAPVLLDSSEFFGLSAEARLVLLFGRMSLGQQPIQMRVGKVLDRLNGCPEARELLLKKYQPAPNETFQAYLERVIERLNEESKEQSAVQKRQRETAAGLIQSQVERSKDAGAEDQEETVQADLTAARQRLEAFVGDKASADQRQAARAPSLQRREKLRAGIENYKPQSAAFEVYEKGIADADGALASYDGKESPQEASERLNGLTHDSSATSGTIAALRLQLREIETEHAAILQAECCPTCSAKKAGWKAVAVERFEAKQKEITQALKDAEEKLEGLVAETGKAKNLLAAAHDVERAKREAARKREEQANQLERARTAREFIAEMQPELDDLDRAFPVDAADRDAEEIAHLLDAITDARADVQTHEARIQRIADIRLESKQITEATTLRDRAENLAAAYKTGQRLLQEVRDEFMADAFKPLLVSVNRYAKGILKTPLEYRANGLGRVGEVKGNWIPFSAFSGTEQAVVLCGVQLALGSESKAKVAIVDELGRLDADRKRQLIRNVAQAITEGQLDQFIGVDVDAAPYATLIKPEDLKVPPLPVNLVRLADPLPVAAAA